MIACPVKRDPVYRDISRGIDLIGVLSLGYSSRRECRDAEGLDNWRMGGIDLIVVFF